MVLRTITIIKSINVWPAKYMGVLQIKPLFIIFYLLLLFYLNLLFNLLLYLIITRFLVYNALFVYLLTCFFKLTDSYSSLYCGTFTP